MLRKIYNHTHGAPAQVRPFKKMDEAINIIITQLIRPRMDELGLSERQLAIASGISQSQVNAWLTGKSDITLTKFFMILRTLRISPQYSTGDTAEAADTQFQVEAAGRDTWRCVDVTHGFFVTWKAGLFNDTSKVKCYQDQPQDVAHIARLMRMMGDWLFLHHPEKL